MATLSRQPFAPLDGSRLQNLTSFKNRQNAITSPSGKRKAESIDTDDSENVDPIFFAKRSKGDTANDLTKDFIKPSAYVLKTTTPSSAPASSSRLFLSPKKPTPASRRALQSKAPAAKLNTGITKSSAASAPAGRSPTRGKRAGLLSNRRRTAGPYSRVDPPAFNLGSAAPFSLDAALKGTFSNYGASKPSTKNTFAALNELDMKASWTFEIHEDTPEQEMTNLLQHGTCVLDISSDEESERKIIREEAEGLDKENVPPMDDVSQTARRTARSSPDDMVVEKERVALGEMNAADFYAEGLDESSVILIHDDEEQPREAKPMEPAKVTSEVKSLPSLPESEEDIDALMSKSSRGSSKAAVLEPLEGTGESFELWESGSNKDDTEAGAATSAST